MGIPVAYTLWRAKKPPANAGGVGPNFVLASGKQTPHKIGAGVMAE